VVRRRDRVQHPRLAAVREEAVGRWRGHDAARVSVDVSARLSGENVTSMSA
jgi:hypothetical protein